MTKEQAQKLVLNNEVVSLTMNVSRGVYVNNGYVQLDLVLAHFIDPSFDNFFEQIVKNRKTLKNAVAVLQQHIEEKPEDE